MAKKATRRPSGLSRKRNTSPSGGRSAFSLATGRLASSVVLKPSDAQAAGINTANLSYTTPIVTANGSTFAASIQLESIAVGSIVIRDVAALVARPGSLRESLLGMSFLQRLGSFEFSREFLTLRS